VPRSSRSSTFCVVITTGLLVLSALMMVMAMVVGCSGTTNAPSLVVTSFATGEGAADAPMRLRFDRPAVQAHEVGAPLPVAPVEVSPALKVAAYWLDRQTLVVKPLSSLKSSTRYRVKLRGTLAGRSNQRTFQFVHRPLAVRALGVLKGEHHVECGGGARPSKADPRCALSPRPAITLSFNQPVQALQLTAGCALQQVERGGEASLELETSDPELVATRLTLRPRQLLRQGARYRLRCAGITGWGGDAPLPEPYEATLRTHAALKVTGFGPGGGSVAADEVPIRIEFSTPVDLEQVRRHVVIWPGARGMQSGYLDAARTRYSASLNLRVSTGYAIRVRRGLTDIYGQSLGRDALHRFKTGDASPQLSLETGIYAVEARRGASLSPGGLSSGLSGEEPRSSAERSACAPPEVKGAQDVTATTKQPAGYPVWSRNVSRFTVECAAVSRAKIPGLLTSYMDYDPWYDASSNKGGVPWGKLGLKRQVKQIRIAHRKNKWELHNLRLNEICGGPAEHRGLYLAQLTSPEVQRGLDQRLRQQDYYSFRYPFRVLANVTNLGVLVKAGTASGLVWVTRISDGQPVKGATVSVFSPRGKQLHRGVTDPRGMLRLPGSSTLLRQAGTDGEDFESWRAQRLLVVVEQGGDMAVVDGNWQNGIQIWNFGLPTDRAGGKTRIRGFIQSDRGIYRPGEKVHFKGLVREIAVGQAPRVPAGVPVNLLIKDSRDATIFRRRLSLTAFGGFAFDLGLSSEAALGDYTVTATVAQQSFVERFQVEAFRKVTYELELSGARRHERLGRTVKLALDARYLFGAPVSRASVRWNVQRRAHQLRFPAFADYAFEDYGARGDYFWHWDRDRDRELGFISDGEGQTDEQGKLSFSFRDPERTIQQPQDYLVQVTATDATDQSVSKRVVITGHRSALYVGLHAQEFVQAVDMPFAVNAVALAPEGQQLATSATLSYIRQTQACSTSGGFRALSSCKVVQRKVWSREVAIPATGVATERIIPREPGEYVIRLEAADARGHRVAASSYVWVVGKGEAFWSGDESARMSLVASRSEYTPGQTARLVARGALSGSTALVTLERDGILEARVVRVKTSGEGIEIPVRELHAPNVFASVVMVRGRTGSGDANRPLFRMGMVNLQVSAHSQRLKVQLETDRETYEPAMSVSGKIRVTDAQGKPVRAELSLSVADEGVLQLIAYKTPDPMLRFFAPWGLGVDSSTNWNRIARLNDPQDIEGSEGGGDSGASGGARVRSRFVSSAFWAPALVTDAAGEVAFSFRAPDNLTAFRLMAVAADTGSRFGSGERRITIRKPLLAKPVLPRFLSVGDQAEVGVMLHNYTGAAGTATVTASGSGVRLGLRSRRVELPASGAARVSFPVTTTGPRQAIFTFTASMGQHTDALRLKLPVHRPVVLEQRTLARGELDSTVVVAMQWPGDLLQSESRLEVTVDRTGLGELQESLRYLVQYPYGCLEQTLSRLIPLTRVRDLASSLGMRQLQGPRLERFIRAGVSKVVRHQHAGGHFSLWPSGEVYPHLTAFALYGLTEARQAGERVDDAAMQRGARALRGWANGSGRSLSPRGESATMAMAAYVLARMAQPDPGLNARLFEARRVLPRHGQAFLLRALKHSGASREQQQTMLDELLGSLTVEGDGAMVHEKLSDRALYMDSDVRSTAIVLSALLEVDPANVQIPRLVQGLKQARCPDGHWYNTQDNLYSLVALSDFARQRTMGTTAVTLFAGGQRVARARLTGSKVLAFSRPLSRLRQGPLRLAAAGGKALYTVRLIMARDAAPDVKARDAGLSPGPSGGGVVDHGFKVEREYRDLASGMPLQTTIKAGQLVQVLVKVQSSQQRHYVALVDPLPAGLEPVNDQLATSAQAGRRSTTQQNMRWYPDGYRPAGWTHQELHDDRVLAFADRLDAGRFILEYVARATITGRFAAAGPRVEAMYEPDINGHGAATRIEVQR